MVTWSTASTGSSVTVTLVEPDGTTTRLESGMTVTDRLTIDVDSGGGKTYAGLKMATYPPTPGSLSAGDWTLLISKNGVTAYTVDIEVT